MAVTTEKGTKKSAEGDRGVVSVGNQALLPGAPTGTLKLCLVRSAASSAVFTRPCPAPGSRFLAYIVFVHMNLASLSVAMMVRSLQN